MLTTRPRRSIDDECDKLLVTLDGGERSASRPGRALLPGKGPPVPTVQEGGWAPEPVWTQRLEEKSFTSAKDQTSIARSSSALPDTMLTELPGSPNDNKYI
jgi:hypothetical protein